jgi:glutaredoxin-related protein
MVDIMEDKYLRDTTEYEQLGTVGQSYTKAEKAAGSDGTRQLTQTDPFPQTIYRVKAKWSDPMLINVNLSVRR